MTDAPAHNTEIAFDQVLKEHSGDFLRLSRLWRRNNHHSFIFAAVNSDVYRDGLITRLDDNQPSLKLQINKGSEPLAWLQRLEENKIDGVQRAHIVLAQGFFPDADWWRQANTLRERLADAFPWPQLFWAPDAVITTLARNAPDLWNWREIVCDFTLHPETAQPISLATPAFDFVGDQDAKQLQQRLQDIEDYIDRHGAGGAAAHLLLEAAKIHWRLGNLSLSEESAATAAAAFREQDNKSKWADARDQVADILQLRGQLDEALAILQNDLLPVYERLGDVRSAAVTKGRIADILQDRGQLDEALAIRQNDQLPVFERLGDVREAAVTKGKIADILQTRGQLDEALAIRQNDELSVYERLGDVRSAAVTKGRIADIFMRLGQLDEALAILQNDLLPVYERLGDLRSAAVTKGYIADILMLRGQLDEALAIRQNETLPVYERLGDVRSAAVTKGKIADILQDRGQLDEALAIRQNDELPVFERLGDVREAALTKGRIANILQARGQLDEALAILQNDELPVYERLGDVRSALVAKANTSSVLLKRAKEGDVEEAVALLQEALASAKELKLPGDIAQIEKILQAIPDASKREQ